MNPLDPETPSDQKAQKLLEIIRELVTELHPGRSAMEPVTLDSSFEKELGLDSLSRVELISRVEARFNVALGERVFAEAQTPRDLLRALLETVSPKTAFADTAEAGFKLDDRAELPADAQTLADVLEWHVAHHGDRPHIQFYQDDGEGEVITYADLKAGALKAAAVLQGYGLAPSEPVAIMLPTSAEYFYSFYGILLAGGVPVPIYPPARPSQLEEHLQRHTRILDNCLARILITIPEAKPVARLLKSHVPTLEQIVSASELRASSVQPVCPVLNPNDTAFLQYTSGSTGNPKGVVLTHANLLSNIRAMGKAVDAGPKDVFVSWLPLYHDMGLIGAWLGSLYFASLFVVMSPLSFLSRPERWLRAIQRYGGTLSASPNFGYEYCLHRLQDADLAGLDLSTWRAAFNGAEAVSPQTLEQFGKRFAPYGFRQEAMTPVYGLAESSVGLAFPPMRRGVRIDRIDRERFMRTKEAVPAGKDDTRPQRFVSCGLPLNAHQIRVVDMAGHELPERREGRLEFRGPSSTSGYYRNAEKSRELFDGEWLDTGDLAYIANGELYLTGRIKDIIIRAGHNIYPDELEKAVGNIEGIRKGCVAIFASSDTKSATERLVILAETRLEEPAKREKLRNAVNALAVDLIGTPADEVVLAPPGSVLKTSSGKIRRAASRELYEKGEIGTQKRSLYWQLVRLAAGGLLPVLRRGARYGASLFFALYSWGLFALLSPVVWLGALLLPDFSMRWGVMRRCAQLLATATGTSITLKGVENLPPQGSTYVLVANHASYIDSYALVAALPRHFRFIAKEELSQRFITRAPLRGIHTEFVERFEIDKSVADTKRLGDLLKAGHALFFFPEGSFTRVPGVMPFHLGAFSIAAEAEAPIIPIAIRGTRSILRSGSWFPHRGAITITVGEPVDPREEADEAKKEGWHLAIRLRERCRDFILRHCGEPDLA